MNSGLFYFLVLVAVGIGIVIIVNLIRDAYYKSKDRQKREQDIKNGLYNETQKQNLSDRFK